jgi:hypothetical protein
MNMREVHLELEALEIGLRESGGLAVRLLRSAATACAGRDAARANVVLAFERDARREQGRAEAAARSLAASGLHHDEAVLVRTALRFHAQTDRAVELALRIADLARLGARRGAPGIDDLDRTCRLAAAVGGTLEEALRRQGSGRMELTEMAAELLQRAESAAADCERQLERGRRLCLVS